MIRGVTNVDAFRTFLVPLDGSELAARALPYAKRLAQSTGSRVVLVTAITEPEGAVRQLNRQDVQLTEASSELRKGGVKVDAVTRPGNAREVIIALAKEIGADLIVMSTHGRSGVGRVVLGSVAEHVLRMAGLPVLLVTPHSPSNWSPNLHGPVVVSLDGSGMAESAVVPAQRLAQTLGAGLSLIRIVEPVEVISPDALGPTGMLNSTPYGGLQIDLSSDLTSQVDAAEDYLQQFASTLGAETPLETKAIIGDPASTICQVAVEQGAAAIALSTHVRSGLDRLVLGSVAISAVRHAAMPVLAVHPAATTE